MWSENSFRHAGISRVGHQLIEQLTCRNPGDRFDVYTNVEFEAPVSWGSRANLQVFPVCPVQRGRKALWESFGAGRLARSGSYDVWLSTAHSVPFRAGIPTATFIHDMIPLSHPEFQDWLQSAYLRWALVRAARRSTAVLTNSETTKSEIVRFAGVPAEKVTVCGLGPGSSLDRGGTAYVPFPFRKFLLCLGTLEPRKNLSTLFSALALMDRDLRLIVVGGQGWKTSPIFRQLRELGIENRVHFAGYLEDSELPAFFGVCEAFVFPSLYEGFGMPILEAMACGALVLTSDRGAMKEVAGDAAGYFDPEDPRSIADAIEKFVVRGEGREELVARGRERARMFTWESAADKVMEVLRGMA